MTGLACAVLEEIGGFSKDELEGVHNKLDTVPLTLLGELCAGQLIPLSSDAELEVFLASAESPNGPAIIEVRPRGADSTSAEEFGSPSPTTPPATATPATNGSAAHMAVQQTMPRSAEAHNSQSARHSSGQTAPSPAAFKVQTQPVPPRRSDFQNHQEAHAGNGYNQ